MTSIRAFFWASGLSLTLGLACDDGAHPGNDGSTALQIKGAFDNCPAIKSIMVSPASVTVGQSGLATVTATDKDPTDTLTFTWTTATGTFATPTKASSLYTCVQAGTANLSVKVSDGRCDSTSTVAVTCQALP